MGPLQRPETGLHACGEGVAKAASQLCEHRGPPRGPLDILWISHPQRAAPRRRQAVIQQPPAWGRGINRPSTP